MFKYLLLFLLLIPLQAFSQDRVTTHVTFKKFIWLCPVCGVEEIVDANVGGGNEYVHTCKNGHTFNQSGSNMKEYNGMLRYYEDMSKVSQETIDADKKKRCDDWNYEQKHPPAYVAPSQQDYINLYNEKLDEAKRYLEDYAKKATTEELEQVKTEGISKVNTVSK
jgi:hypothetical protein